MHITRLGSRAGLAAGAATICLVLAGCSTSVDKADVEQEIQDKLAAQGATVEDVSCEEDLKGEEGETGTCSATIDGTETDVLVEVTSVEDNVVNFSIELPGEETPEETPTEESTEEPTE